MNISNKGIDMLMTLEACKLRPYDDATGKTIKEWCKGATIGVGHLIHQKEWDKYKNGTSKKCAICLLKEDLQRFKKCIDNKIKIDLWQSQFDALVIFAFNIGVHGFKISSALKLINNAYVKTSYANLEDAWKAWNKSNGEIVRGLINRRHKEWNLYKYGSYC